MVGDVPDRGRVAAIVSVPAASNEAPCPPDAGSTRRGSAATRRRSSRSISVEEVDLLTEMSRAELVQRWAAIYGSPPPSGIKRPLLERAIAWHLQAKRFGGLPARTTRELRELQPCPRNCRAADAEQGMPKAKGSSSSSLVSPSRRALRPGMRLVREWQGRTHVVDVTSSGFAWNGGTHRSLSAIARKITGARWSGPRFFGL